MATVPLVSRVNTVYFYVRDVARSATFYRDVLGIPMEGDGEWAEATFPDGVRFALHTWHADVGEIGSGTVQINLEVADVDEAVAQVRGAGVEAGEIERDFWGAACEIVDPDGYRIQLYQPPL